MLFLPQPASHMAKGSVGEGCVHICKPLRGLCELINGNGLNVTWHRVKALLLLLLIVIIVVVMIISSSGNYHWQNWPHEFLAHNWPVSLQMRPKLYNSKSQMGWGCPGGRKREMDVLALNTTVSGTGALILFRATRKIELIWQSFVDHFQGACACLRRRYSGHFPGGLIENPS